MDVGKHTVRVQREFLGEMERVVPWSALIALIEPHWPKGKAGRPPFAICMMLRIHFLQQWLGLSDPAMAEALHDVPLYREFAGIESGLVRLPDESTILRFRHLLEKHQLAAQMLAAVNDTLRQQGLLLKTGTVDGRRAAAVVGAGGRVHVRRVVRPGEPLSPRLVRLRDAEGPDAA